VLLKPDPEDIGKIIVKIVGLPKCISRCKFYLASNEILTSHEMTNTEIEQLRENKENDKAEETVENSIEPKKCFYNMWNVIGKLKFHLYILNFRKSFSVLFLLISYLTPLVIVY